MGDHALDSASWWARVRLLEPARVRAVVTALVTIAAVWGVNASPLGDRLTETWDQVWILLPIISALAQGEWTRTVVSPSAVNGLGK